MCAGNGAGEALAGGGVGPVLSRERNEQLSGADPLGDEGGPHRGARYRQSTGPGAVRDPVHAPRHLVREPGGPAVGPGGWSPGPHREPMWDTPMTHDRRKSDRPIQPREPREQGRSARCAAGGAGGGKGAGQGERARAPQVPGADSDRPATRRSNAYGKQRFETGRCRSRRCGTTSTPSTASGRSYLGLKREAAPGVDRMTWSEYGQGLEADLKTFRPGSSAARIEPNRSTGPTSRKPTEAGDRRALRRWRTRSSRRQPWRCSTRFYEVDFLGFSYGFRPGRSPAQGAGCVGGGDSTPQSELGTRRGHPWVLRHHRPRMAGEVRRAPCAGPTRGTPPQEVAQRGGPGRGQADRRRGRDAPGGQHITPVGWISYFPPGAGLPPNQGDDSHWRESVLGHETMTSIKDGFRQTLRAITIQDLCILIATRLELVCHFINGKPDVPGFSLNTTARNSRHRGSSPMLGE